MTMKKDLYGQQPIAVVAMAVRTAGAADTDAFWRMIESGKSAICQLTPETLTAAGVPVDLMNDVNYRPFAAPLELADYFEHDIFGISEQEASRMDPQHRIFLQVAWSALESAGYVPRQVAPLTGVFASTRFSMRLALGGLDLHSHNTAEVLQQVIGTDKDYLATRVSYLLDLQGPSMTVQSACSSSLLAVHLAVQSLLSGECDMALAGGVTINEPQQQGYIWQEGMILSADGTCRPFDATASGTLGGNGCGVVILRRLEDALVADERIIAVIRGSAVNNDGAAKIGYTAPGLNGQIRVVREAMAIADVDPSSVGYIETHGTGTALGDPIEFQALCEAFSAPLSSGKPHCALGSIKANIGHLDAAAGIVSLIKTLLALQHKRIPPMTNFTRINPRISLSGNPFYIPLQACDWPEIDGVRRAGVSSFGFGGTNVHIQLQAWRETQTNTVKITTDNANTQPLNLFLSAAGTRQCELLAAKWADVLRNVDLTQARNACYQALFARRHHQVRLALTATDQQALCHALSTVADGGSHSEKYTIFCGQSDNASDGCVWVFAGQGLLSSPQIQNWYQRGEIFRHTLEQCTQLAGDRIDVNFRQLLLEPQSIRLQQPRYAQPALFVLQVALAAQWQEWGLKPVAVLGHSLGEYAAAWVAGSLTLEQGLTLVLQRGWLAERLDPGAMLAVKVPEHARTELLSGLPIDLAAVNTAETVVYSGDTTTLDHLALRAEKAGYFHRKLPVNRAMHSRYMQPILNDFYQFASQYQTTIAKIPFYSTVTGERLYSAPNADYWVRHLRQPVLFTDALTQLQTEHQGIVLELGSDTTLSKLIRNSQPPPHCVASIDPKFNPLLVVDSAVAALYSQGIELNWQVIWPQKWQRQLALPTYPFIGKPFPVPPAGNVVKSQALDFQRITQAAERQALRGLPLLDPDQFIKGRHQLERLSQVLVCKALGDTFPVLQENTPLFIDELCEQAQIVPELRQYTARLIRALAVQGEIYAHNDGRFSALQRPTDEQVQQIHDESNFIWQKIPQLRNAFLDTAEALPDILCGRRSALEVMHSGGGLDNALSIYSDTPTSRYFNAILREAFRVLVATLPPSACLRVLEIGAGSGATAQQLLPLMEPEYSQYLFTDISAHFVQAARQRLAKEYTFSRFKIYDVSLPPENDGLAAGSVDVVVAVNVLHAVADLQAAINSIEYLLADGGILLLYELTEANFSSELSTGILIGTVTDTLRDNQVFIDVDRWFKGLQAQGFEQVACFPSAGGAADLAGEHVLIARKTGSYQIRDTLQQEQVTEDYFYHWHWQQAETLRHELQVDCWLVLPDTTGKASQIAASLQSKGQQIRLLSEDDELSLQLATCIHPAVLLCVDEYAMPENQDAQAQAGCNRLLQLVKLLHIASQPVALAGLCLVTCEAAIGLRSHTHAAQSSLQGLARVIALGHPQFNIRLLDKDSSANAENVAEALLNEQSWAALDNGQIYLPALQKREIPQSVPVPYFSQQETVLIIGGLGGIGCQLTLHLAQLGAGRLIITARHRKALPASLQYYADRIIIRQVDVTDEQAMRALLTEIDTYYSPLTAVFHCAVDSRIKPEDSTDAQQLFSRVLAPKVQGGWLLHQLTCQHNLRYFVLFSSAVSLAPSYGLPHYVAANAFLDGLACWRRSLGLNAISIGWGAWRDVGVVANAGQAGRLEKGGLRSFSSEQGLRLLDRVLSTDITHCGIIDMDWPEFLRQFSADAIPDEYRHLQSTRAVQHSVTGAQIWQSAGLAQRLRNATTHQQRKLLENYLQHAFASLLGRKDENMPLDVNLMELGVDSLMFLDAVNHMGRSLQIAISANALFRNFTLNGIINQLLYTLANNENGRGIPILQADVENRYEPFPLSDVQQAYWVGRSESIGLGEISCFGYSEFDCPGLDVPRLEQAWNQVIARHDMLRAIICEDATQRVLPEVPAYCIEVTDFRALSAEQQERALQQRRNQLSHQLRAADHWPLFDIRVSQLTNDLYRLHFGLDNIMTDGHSIDMLIQQLINLYHGKSLPETPVIGFRDYQMALQDYRQTEEYAQSRAYWLQRLDDIYPAPQLPLSATVKSLRAPRFVRRSFSMPSQRWQQLRGLAAKQAGLTPSGLLLAAFAEVLARWSVSPCFTLNVPTFNRLPLHPQVNEIVGEFTSVILLSIDAGRPGQFSERARYVQQRLLDDLRHEAFSGVQVTRALVRRQADPQTVRMPVVFTSTFGLNSETDLTHAQREQSVLGLGDEIYSISQTPQVLLDNHVHDKGGELHVHWDCVDAAFPAGVLQRMFDMYIRLLESLAEGLQSWQSTAPLMLAEQDQEAWQHYNQTLVTDLVSPGQTLVSGFIQCCQTQPHAPALICGEQCLSYQQLGQLAASIAGTLVDCGVEAGQPVGVMLEKNVSQIAAVLGILLSGAAYVPLDLEYPPSRLQTIIDQFGDAMLILTNDLMAVAWPGAIAISDALNHSPLPLQIRSLPESLAYVIFTSGTSGTAKGVAVTHHAALTTINDINNRLSVTEQDVVLGVSALGFDLSVYDIFGMLTRGGLLVLPQEQQRKEPQAWMRLMQQHNVTLWNSAPVYLQMLLEEPGDGLQSLKWALISGDWIALSLPDQLRARAPAVDFYSLGGATEAAIWSVCYRVKQVAANWSSIPYGHPLANQRLYVLDSHGQLKPPGVSGELWIAGDGLAQQYWADKERTDAAFKYFLPNNERRYRTGDMARLLDDGYIEFQGRQDNQVKIRGYRIELGEIEVALRRCQGVLDALVVAQGQQHNSGYSSLVAYLIAQRDNPLDLSLLRRQLAECLPVWMIPAYWMVLDSWPVTDNGKIDRRALPPVERTAIVSGQIPANDVENQLIRLLSEILDYPQLGTDTHLFEVGFDSLSLARASVKLREAGFSISLRDFFLYPQIEQLAKAIQSAKTGEPVNTQNGTPQNGFAAQRLANGGKTVLCLHGATGGGDIFLPLCAALPADWGYQMPDLDLSNYTTLQQCAAELVNNLTSMPDIVIGHSAGGLLSWQLAMVLQQQGHPVQQLLLIDSAPVSQDAGNAIQAFAYILGVKQEFLPTLQALFQQTDSYHPLAAEGFPAFSKHFARFEHFLRLSGEFQPGELSFTQQYLLLAEQGNPDYIRQLWAGIENLHIRILDGDHNSCLRGNGLTQLLKIVIVSPVTTGDNVL